jgi:hypothetical protein
VQHGCRVSGRPAGIGPATTGRRHINGCFRIFAHTQQQLCTHASIPVADRNCKLQGSCRPRWLQQSARMRNRCMGLWLFTSVLLQMRMVVAHGCLHCRFSRSLQRSMHVTGSRLAECAQLVQSPLSATSCSLALPSVLISYLPQSEGPACLHTIYIFLVHLGFRCKEHEMPGPPHITMAD